MSRGYVVKNELGSYNKHGHFKKLKTCYTIIRLIQKGKVPKSKYLRISAVRLSTDKKYIDKVSRKIAKDKDKQRYININKGI
ncbi:MAG TPA: hypothetical protein GX526_02355 [Thermoanaerobacterales bacterium]|nr:hypothetical protein [Thermoanaerobacterales bacterium]